MPIIIYYAHYIELFTLLLIVQLWYIMHITISFSYDN